MPGFTYLIDNDHWDTTLEFKVRLKSEGLAGAVLGHYLFEARVTVIPPDLVKDFIFC